MKGSDKKKANLISRFGQKHRKDENKDLRDELIILDEDSLETIAEDHMVIAKYKHTIEIMRWHGLHNLDGRYAFDSLVTIKQKIKEYWAKDLHLREKIKAWYAPWDKVIKLKKSKNKQMETHDFLEGADNDKDLVIDPKDFNS